MKNSDHRCRTGNRAVVRQWSLFAFVFFACHFGSAQSQDVPEDNFDVNKHFNWETIAELPAPAGQDRQPGLAGVFSGIVNDVLIIAGGANFPLDPPWEGGKKVWHDEIYVLGKRGATYEWLSNGEFALDRPRANGISLMTDRGLLCIGGENSEGPSDNLSLLTWEVVEKKVQQKSLRKLPAGFHASAAFTVGQVLYVTGVVGVENKMISIPLPDLFTVGESPLGWSDLEGCPGPPRMMPAYAAQSNGQDQCLFLFGGRSVLPQGTILLSDAFYYNTRTRTWHRIEACPPVMAAAALPYGPSSIILFGGDDGKLLLQRDSLQQLIRTSADLQIIDSATRQLRKSFAGHPGFRREILSFNTITKSFQPAGNMPGTPPVVTTASYWNGNVVLPGGEVKPGVRTTEIFSSAITKTRADFQLLDYVVLVIYFLLMLGIGFYFSGRQNSTEDYFTGGGRVPWWAAGLSVFGTALSAITFMAIPAKTFATNWTYSFYNASILFATPLVTMLFIPFYRRLKLTTAYEYLEQRFNVGVRMFGSLSFMLFQLGRIAIILYLPAIALSLVTGIDIFVCILVVGILSTAYTMVGGIEAVIWTDVVQVVILMGGALFALLFMFVRMGDDFSGLASQAYDHGKFTLANLTFALNEPTIWVVVVGGFFINLVTYSSDQSLVQRYLTTPDEKSATKTAWTNAILSIPSTIIFFGIGSALYMYYLEFPTRADPFMNSNDSIFPWFITNELPAGISGLLIAGVFSAAMSSVSSSMNSISTAFTTDFFRRFRKTTDQSRDLYVARIATMLSGVLGIACALWMATSDIVSLWDKFFEVLGLFTGGLGGVFLLGMLFRRANAAGAVAGLIASSAVQYVVLRYSDLHSLLYVATGVVTCMVVGYLASLLMPDPANAAKKLTFHHIHTKIN